MDETAATAGALYRKLEIFYARSTIFALLASEESMTLEDLGGEGAFLEFLRSLPLENAPSAQNVDEKVAAKPY